MLSFLRKVGLAGLFAGVASLAGVALSPASRASPEIDRLAGLASKGDAAALDALLGAAGKKKDADAKYALGRSR